MRQIKWVVYGLVIGLILTLCNCATLFTGTEGHVVIRTEPSGAKVKIGDITALTPATITIKERGHFFAYPVTIEKEGYETYTTEIKTTPNPMCLLNFLSFGPVGLIVDIVAGADSTLDKTLIDVRLMGK